MRALGTVWGRIAQRVLAKVCAFGSACVPSQVERATEVLVVVDSSIDDLASVRIEVFDPEGRHRSGSNVIPVRQGSSVGVDVPFSLSVEKAATGGLDRFLLVASGFDVAEPEEGREPLVSQRFRVRFTRQLTTRLVVRLNEVCRGVRCDADLTCYTDATTGAATDCVPTQDISALPTVVPGQELQNLGTPVVLTPDAAADDAGADPALDAGSAAPEDAAPAPPGRDAAEPSADATVAADCRTSPCLHGGQCVERAQGYVCDCSGTGYAGTRCAAAEDECSASGTCDPAYPCERTPVAGYICRGQLADWPMPDAVPGAHISPSYATDVAGTVADLVTGLMWEEQPEVIQSDFYSASARCSRLRTADFQDWRLPSRIELVSILDHTRFNPASSPHFLNMVGNYYWTASPDTGLAGVSHYWSVSFYNGIVSSDAAELEHYTRCVRSPTPVATGAPRTRLTIDEAADLITDTRTGLVWQRTPSANAVPRPEAFATCAALGAGLRLPTAKELLTLVDPMRSNPSLLEGFPDPPSKGFWSASLNGSRPDTYVGVYFSDGHTSWASPEVLYYVRCVR